MKENGHALLARAQYDWLCLSTLVYCVILKYKIVKTAKCYCFAWCVVIESAFQLGFEGVYVKRGLFNEVHDIVKFMILSFRNMNTYLFGSCI